MLSQLRPAILLFVILSLITGVIYPLAITGVAQIAFPHEANGSIVVNRDGGAVGSSLIGQEFSTGEPKETARWFWGRLSATGPVPYSALNLQKAMGSSGSNLATTNPALIANVNARLAGLAAADAAAGIIRPEAQSIPIDLVTSSASGLDPHISIVAAEYQVARVAKSRGMSEQTVRSLVARHTSGRTFGVLGEPVVNVLELNLELNQQSK